MLGSRSWKLAPFHLYIFCSWDPHSFLLVPSPIFIFSLFFWLSILFPGTRHCYLVPIDQRHRARLNEGHSLPAVTREQMEKTAWTQGKKKRKAFQTSREDFQKAQRKNKHSWPHKILKTPNLKYWKTRTSQHCGTETKARTARPTFHMAIGWNPSCSAFAPAPC